MEITIKYDSIWGNSFLSSPDEKKRKYIASSSNMNDKKNKNINNKLDFYKKREIGLTTVLGLVYRLMGARAPLSSLLKEDESFFSELIKKNAITFENHKTVETDELVYLRNNNLNTDQKGYSGVPNESILTMGVTDPLKVLFYTREELVSYLIDDLKPSREISEVDEISIIEISEKLEDLYKEKTLKVTQPEEGELFSKEYDIINKSYQESMEIEDNIHNKASLGLLAINKAMFLFSKENDLVMQFLTKSGTFAGVSLNGNTFTLKDFMKKFAASKIVYGNPYVAEFLVLNQNSKEGKNMKFNKKLTKSNGLLKIQIDCDRETAVEIKDLIESSGVSAFYLGKKGLAYTQKITL